MNKENTKKLLEKYPKIFAQHKLDPSQTCMCWLFECDDGWYDLLNMLCSHIQFDIEKNGYPELEAVQVKEKFGTLRFYTTGVRKKDKTFKERMRGKLYNFLRRLMYRWCREMYQANEGYHVQEGMIRFAEFLSGHVCERCGSNQKVTQTKGWVVSLCPKCLAAYKKKRGLK